jgi:hypothetical protein
LTTYFSIRIAKPAGDGWVRLPAERPKRSGIAAAIRGKDKDLSEWAAATARELLGHEADPKLLDRYVSALTGLAAGARERDVKLAYAWMPGTAGLAVARIDVSMIRTSRQYPELTMDTLAEQFAQRDASTTELEVSGVELPVGPAIRLRREWRGGDSPADTAVSVTYVCRPPEIKNAVVYTMYWSLADDDPQLAEIADSLAATLRIAT